MFCTIYIAHSYQTFNNFSKCPFKKNSLESVIHHLFAHNYHTFNYFSKCPFKKDSLESVMHHLFAHNYRCIKPNRDAIYQLCNMQYYHIQILVENVMQVCS